MAAKIIKAQGHALYIVVQADSQPWAAKCIADADGEKIKREWLKVRHARDTEAKAASMDASTAWVVIVPWDFDGFCEIGKLRPNEAGKDRLHLKIGAQIVTQTTRQQIEEALFNPATGAVETVDDFPF